MAKKLFCQFSKKLAGNQSETWWEPWSKPWKGMVDTAAYYSSRGEWVHLNSHEQNPLWPCLKSGRAIVDLSVSSLYTATPNSQTKGFNLLLGDISLKFSCDLLSIFMIWMNNEGNLYNWIEQRQFGVKVCFSSNGPFCLTCDDMAIMKQTVYWTISCVWSDINSNGIYGFKAFIRRYS